MFFLSDRTGSRPLHRIRLGGGEAEALTDWNGEISDARPIADARLVAVVATDEPTEEDERRRAERDDAIVWGEQLCRGRLRVLDLATGELRTVDGLALDGLLVLPTGRSRVDGPFPLITWVHGGPPARYADQFLLGPRSPAQWLAAARRR